MKTKIFNLPSVDTLINKKSKIASSKVIIMPQNPNEIERNREKNKKSFLTIEQLTAEIMKYDKIDIRLAEIKKVDMKGILFILSIMDSHKNINLDIDIEKDINPQLKIISRKKIKELKNG